MAKRKKQIKLSENQRSVLEQFISKGSKGARLIRRAQIILALNVSDNQKPLTDGQIAHLYHVSRQTVYVVQKEFLNAKSLESFLKRKKRNTPPIAPKVTGDVTAHIIALCCSTPPDGYARWTVRLLADKCIELGLVDSISHMTVSRTLKKTNLSLT